MPDLYVCQQEYGPNEVVLSATFTKVSSEWGDENQHRMIYTRTIDETGRVIFTPDQSYDPGKASPKGWSSVSA